MLRVIASGARSNCVEYLVSAGILVLRIFLTTLMNHLSCSTDNQIIGLYII